LHTNKI